MNKEILLIVQALSNEKGVSEGVIFEAIEAALAAVAARRYPEEEGVDVRVTIDRKTGEYESFRCWTVIEDDVEIEYPGRQIPLNKAIEEDSSLSVGDRIDETIDNPDFGRIAAQQAKHVIIQKVREAEREKIAQQYRHRVGEMMIGVVKRVTRDNIILDMGMNTEALLPREQMIQREAFRVNDRLRAMLVEVRDESRGPQLLLSRTHPDFLIELFKIEVPEIAEEVIQIRAAARDPGLRAKIAVKTNDGRIDPVGACVGMRGARVQAVSNELAGERIDIVLWDDNPAQLVINAMAPAEVASIVVDEDTHSMDIAVSEQFLSQAIGRAGQNVRLASELTGWRLNVMSEEQAQDKHESENQSVKLALVDALSVDEEIAEALANEGFKTIEEVAYVDPAEMMAIEGFDEALVEALQGRASDALLVQEIAEQEALDGIEPEAEMLSLEGMTDRLAKRLVKGGIATRDDLAEQSVDELQAVVEIDQEQAAALIMAARKHWFDEA